MTIPNNSLVDIDNILYTVPGDSEPTNTNGLHDQALLCVTDLEDCCAEPHTVRGGWYYPDGNEVTFDRYDGIEATFRRNRGPNEVINGHQFMVQFVSGVDGVIHQEKVVIDVNYLVLMIPILFRPFMQVLVSHG